MFDYEEAQKEVMQGLDILNINGKYITKSALEYLKVCPFFEIVAKHLNMTVDALYQKMKYHLGEDRWKELRADVRRRREEHLEVYKNTRLKELQMMDAVKNDENGSEDSGD